MERARGTQEAMAPIPSRVSCFQSREARENARQLSRVPSTPETTSGPSFDSDYFPKAPIKSWHLGAPALLTMGMFISSIK